MVTPGEAEPVEAVHVDMHVPEGRGVFTPAYHCGPQEYACLAGKAGSRVPVRMGDGTHEGWETPLSRVFLVAEPIADAETGSTGMVETGINQDRDGPEIDDSLYCKIHIEDGSGRRVHFAPVRVSESGPDSRMWWTIRDRETGAPLVAIAVMGPEALDD